MPSQALSRFDTTQRRTHFKRHARPVLSRLFVFGSGLLLTGYGAYEMYGVVSVSSVTILQWLLVGLFTINFSWIALAFTSSVLGFGALLGKPKPQITPTSLKAKTALVMPVYNEAPSRIFAALQAMIEDVEGMDNIEKICAVPGIHCIYIGANDFAQSLGYPGDQNHPAVKKTMAELADRVHKCGGRMREDCLILGNLPDMLVNGASKFAPEAAVAALKAMKG